jgi:hypothetical protein
MENREQQILSEIKSMMGTIRTQLELLDAKMAELQQCVDPEDFDNNPIELELEDIAVEETVVLQPEILEADDDLPFDDVPEAQPDVQPEPEPEPEPEPAPEPEPEPAPAVEEDDDDDLPGVFDQPLSVFEAAQNSPKLKPSVADVMVAEMQAWRTDMPGTPVKDVRSAISLNDRIIFINYLFGEDPLTFQNTITQINTMTTLDQVVDYVKTEFPEWDLNSELVYRFMMAVRRRVK